MSQTRARVVAALTAAVMVLPALAPPAAAGTTACDPNHSWVRITSLRKPYKVTHVDGYHLPPGGEKVIKKSIGATSKIVAGRTISGEVAVSAGKVIAKAEAKAGVNLANNKEHTATQAVEVTDTLASSSDDRYFAAYVASRRFNGSWEKRQCNSRGTDSSRVAYGTWRSFRPNVTVQGIALCPASRYPRRSAPYKACKAAWN